jgi:hypothetical protein
MGDEPVRPDLRALWKELGVSMENGSVHFDQNAELAHVRQQNSLIQLSMNRTLCKKGQKRLVGGCFWGGSGVL